MQNVPMPLNSNLLKNIKSLGLNELPCHSILTFAEAEDKEALFHATAAVLANNPDELRKYSSLLALQVSKEKSLLEMSCEEGYEGCIRVLLEAQWSPSERRTHKETPLHICAKHGHLK